MTDNVGLSGAPPCHSRPVGFPKATLGFLAPLATVIILVVQGVPIVMALLGALCVTSLFSLYLGYAWADIQAAAIRGLVKVLPATFMMILVGIMIAVWIQAGSVPALLFYGINLIDPRHFLPLAFIVCAITCLTTGTSWGTAGTIGLALMGVSQGLGVPLPLTAGAVISGALVGEKMSPISSTTILTAASTNTNLIDHILSMMNTTIPSAVISVVLYSYLGLSYGSHSNDIHTITSLTTDLASRFVLSPFVLAPPIFVLALSAARKPAIPVFVGGIGLGVICAMIFQKASLVTILTSGMYGFKSTSGNALIDSLLSRGGAVSMAETVYLCICAGIFGGILDKQKILTVILDGALAYARGVGSLILATTISCLALMIGGAGQYCTLTLPGVAFRKAFDDRDVHSSVLSRTMEDSGTMVGAIIPWDVSAVYYASILGVSMLDYGPYTFIAWMTPFISVAFGYLGIGVFRREQKVVPLTMRHRQETVENADLI